MAVNIPNPGSYLAQLGNDLVALRNAMNDLQRDAAYVNAMGGAAFFQAAPFNMTAADATNLANTIGTVTPQNATVQAIMNFLNTAIPYTGGL